MIDVSARARLRAPAASIPWFPVVVALTTATVAAALAVLLRTWPPHEDETLALFVGRGSLPDLLHTVVAERGGSPLHFLIAWAVVHLGGGLTALRAVSAVCAVASVPAMAALGARLADRATGALAAVLAAASWVFLFHGVFGRMYSLFLLTSVVSFVALLDALELGGRRRFALWGLAAWTLLATHPYAVLVLAAQALYALARRARLRPFGATALALVVAAAPFWWADVVLRNRFDVGVGGGGARLGTPGAVLDYFWRVAGDMAAGPGRFAAAVVLTALAGVALVACRRASAAVLTVCVVAVPAAAFAVAKLHSTASPEARHLIFALPFFTTAIAAAIVSAARVRPPTSVAVAAAAAALLLAGELRWADEKTPGLFHGDPAGEAVARDRAAAWLASTARRDDVLLGYEPVYLRAWEDDRSFSRNAIPRADPELLAEALRALPEPLGRGVWVFDASDTTNIRERQTIELALPRPARAFQARAYGPYLVIRSRVALVTRRRFLDVSEEVMRLGRRLAIGDADINLRALLVAESRFF